MNTQIRTIFDNKLGDFIKSPGGATLVLAFLIMIFATWHRGAYVTINTLVMGGMLCLMSLGLALVFGVMNIAQFAHGDYFMIGTLTGFYTHGAVGNYLKQNSSSILAVWQPFLTIIAAAIVGAVMGIISERFIFRALRKRTKDNWVMNAFLVTVGLSVFLINGVQIFFGSDYKGITKLWPGKPLEIFGAYLSVDRFYAVILSLLLILLFYIFMKFTRLGVAVRAVSQDERGALMVGINLSFIFTLAMSIACSLASVAGASLLFMFPAYPTVGLEPLYLSWMVIILVGLGNVLGSLAGGFMVALLKVLTNEYIGAGWDYVIPVALVMLVLIFRPSGLFGSTVRGALDR